MASAITAALNLAPAAAARAAPRQRVQARAAALPSRSSEFLSADLPAKALRSNAVARSGVSATGRAASLRVLASSDERSVVLAVAPPKPAWKGAALKVRHGS